MGKLNWRIMMIIILFTLSVLFYFLHYFIFRDVHHIFLYLIGDIAFLFVQVLIVTLILQRFLELREKNALLKKMNMVIGVFFSEAGTELLTILVSMSDDVPGIDKTLLTENGWTKKSFQKACLQAKQIRINQLYSREDFLQIKHFMSGKKEFLLRLLENPILLEHESFTELLWAVFHLAEELTARKDVLLLPKSDVNHLCNDVHRVYSALILQWLCYMDHLREDYPFLFSFARRTNPFYPTTVEINE